MKIQMIIELKKYVYVTFANGDNYAKGVMALYVSLLKVKTPYDLIVLVTKDVSSDMYRQLVLLGCKVRLIEMVPVPKEISLEVERWRPAFTKFRAWEMTEFDKIIWLDSDMLVTQNLDHLFERSNDDDDDDPSNDHMTIFAAVDADANSCQFKPERLELINSGIVVLQPNMDLFQTLLDNMIVASRTRKTVNDQDVLNITVHWLPLPYPQYGVQITHCECKDRRMWHSQSTYFLHYTAGTKELPKPWQFKDFISNTKHAKIPECLFTLYEKWQSYYDMALLLVENNRKIHNSYQK
eukprot:gene4212-5275_t